MRFLRERGILPDDDPLLHARRSTITRDAFFAGAAAVLRAIGPAVRSTIVRDLPRHPGRWHPTGFMVFPLGTHPEWGTLRLHVWPAGIRRRLIQGRGDLGEIYDGDIHNHSWNITSLVLAAYRDNIYAVSPATGDEAGRRDPDDPEMFRKFSVSYHPGSYQSLVTDGSNVVARTARHRRLAADDIHTIDAGVYHAPVLPLDVLGVTLAFSSPRVHRAGPDVLIGGSGDAVPGPRRPVTHREAAEARDQLRAVGAW